MTAFSYEYLILVDESSTLKDDFWVAADLIELEMQDC